MEFEFGKYTEVTELAHEVNPEYKSSSYSRIFLCTDTHDFWLARILVGFNEEYEKEEGSFVLERDKISKDYKAEILTKSKAIELLENDSFENWDLQTSNDEDELIEMVDGGWGILNLMQEA